MNKLPPFPVDDATLDLLMAALRPREHGDPDAQSSNVGDFLDFMSQMGGSDTKAIDHIANDGSDGGMPIHVMRDQQYHDHDVLTALITEVRGLRLIQAELAGRAVHMRDELVEAKNLLADLVVKATEYGAQDGDFVANYILPTGPLHRAMPWLDNRGIVVRPGFDGREAHRGA